MSLGSLGALNVLVSADTAQFTSQMDKAAYIVERDMQRMVRSAKINGAIISSALIAAATGAAFAMRQALDDADKIGKVSKSVGMTSEQFSKLKYAADLSDISIEDLSSSISKMNKSAFTGVSAFSAMGIAVKDADGKMRSSNDILYDLADAFQRMPDGIAKSSAMMEIFGKSGGRMVLLLNDGSTGLKNFGDEAQRFGNVVSASTAAKAEKFNDSLTRMSKIIDGIKLGAASATLDLAFSIADERGKKDTYDALMRIGQYEQAAKIYEQSASNIVDASQKAADAAGEEAASYEAAAEAAEKKAKMEEDAAKLKDSMRTAQEKYNDEMEYYNTLLKGQLIDQETYDRAARKSFDTLSDGTKQTNKMNDAARDLGFSFQSAFEDAIIEGKKFNEVLVSLAQDIERIILRKAVTEPLGNALAAGVTKFFSPNTMSPTQVESYVASKKGNIFSNGNVMPFANGGLVTRPTLFPMANGGTGLAGEAGTEAILPLTRTRGGDLGVKSIGGGGTVVNVYAPSGSNVKQENKMDGDREIINIMIDEAVAGHVGDPGSKTYRSMKNTFGVNQSLTRR